MSGNSQCTWGSGRTPPRCHICTVLSMIYYGILDEAGNKLQVKSVVMCQITPFMIPEEGDIDQFTRGKMEDIYQADDRYFDFLEGQVRELKEEKNQSIVVSMFRALTGIRCRTKIRHVTSIPLTLVTSESTPASHSNTEAASMQ